MIIILRNKRNVDQTYYRTEKEAEKMEGKSLFVILIIIVSLIGCYTGGATAYRQKDFAGINSKNADFRREDYELFHAPYPAAGYRPGRQFQLPKRQTLLPLTEQIAIGNLISGDEIDGRNNHLKRNQNLNNVKKHRYHLYRQAEELNGLRPFGILKSFPSATAATAATAVLPANLRYSDRANSRRILHLLSQQPLPTTLTFRGRDREDDSDNEDDSDAIEIGSKDGSDAMKRGSISRAVINVGMDDRSFRTESKSNVIPPVYPALITYYPNSGVNFVQPISAYNAENTFDHRQALMAAVAAGSSEPNTARIMASTGRPPHYISAPSAPTPSILSVPTVDQYSAW